ncbi:uncharacterized protein LOC143628215 [Bidens hawaiensis]|uniref:uncharacterized protein LOC143628215 n=1 Tax=Bidens hawaiensis TaxID=980011 RepID=UPI00404B238A
MGSLEVVPETSSWFDQIKARMKTAQDLQKTYADKRRRPIEFNVGDNMMLKVSPWKGEVAYRLDLPTELEGIHSTFHVSHLIKCLVDGTSHVPLMDIEVDERLNYIEQPVEIVDRKDKQLRHKVIPLVKVICKHRKGSDATWEAEEEMRRFYPYIEYG